MTPLAASAEGAEEHAFVPRCTRDDISFAPSAPIARCGQSWALQPRLKSSQRFAPQGARPYRDSDERAAVASLWRALVVKCFKWQSLAAT
jgi:hypothetical protein